MKKARRPTKFRIGVGSPRPQSTTRWVRFRGTRMTLSELVEIAPVNKQKINVDYGNFYQRIVLQGWTPERAATTPLRRRYMRSGRR